MFSLKQLLAPAFSKQTSEQIELERIQAIIEELKNSPLVMHVSVLLADEFKTMVEKYENENT